MKMWSGSGMGMCGPRYERVEGGVTCVTWGCKSPRPAYDSLKELAPSKHFHDDVEVLLALVQPLHAYDVRVIH